MSDVKRRSGQSRRCEIQFEVGAALFVHMFVCPQLDQLVTVDRVS